MGKTRLEKHLQALVDEYGGESVKDAFEKTTYKRAEFKDLMHTLKQRHKAETRAKYIDFHSRERFLKAFDGDTILFHLEVGEHNDKVEIIGDGEHYYDKKLRITISMNQLDEYVDWFMATGLFDRKESQIGTEPPIRFISLWRVEDEPRGEIQYEQWRDAL